AYLSTALHAVGTIALGAGIFLTGQIFNLQEHWPSGVMLWALGALLGWLLLRDWPHAGLFALLGPAWLISEWADATQWYAGSDQAPSVFVLALAITYFSCITETRRDLTAKALLWIGGICLLPAYLITTFIGGEAHGTHQNWLPRPYSILGWAAALLLPLAFSWWMRKRIDTATLTSLAWCLAVFLFPFGRDYPPRPHPMLHGLAAFLVGLIGAIGLIVWGMREHIKSRVNMGMALLVVVITIFYFSGFMDKLGRSASLMLFGVLFLIGGYYAEVTRKRLIARLNREVTP
ncbi:MAG: DUF2157 domain-containing protein, partial [Acidobacteriales bacterium]|nr:DUF2157 domain-containing protein [Terriglobales bacterium]